MFWCAAAQTLGLEKEGAGGVGSLKYRGWTTGTEASP